MENRWTIFLVDLTQLMEKNTFTTVIKVPELEVFDKTSKSFSPAVPDRERN